MLNEIATAPSDSAITQRLNLITRSKFGKLFDTPAPAHRMREQIFAATQDTSLRKRAYAVLTTAFVAENEIDSVIHYSLESLSLYNKDKPVDSYTYQGAVIGIMYLHETVQNHTEVAFLADSLLRMGGMDTLSTWEVYNLKITALSELGDYTEALKAAGTLLSMIPDDEPGKYDRLLAMQNLYKLHRLNQDYSSAERWATEALGLAKELKDTFRIVQISSTIGAILIEEGKIEEGRERLLLSLPQAIKLERLNYEALLEGEDDPWYDASDFWYSKGISISTKVGILRSYLSEGRLSEPELLDGIAEVQRLIDNGEEYNSHEPPLEMLAVLTEFYSLKGSHNLALKYGGELLAFAEGASKGYSPRVRDALEVLHTTEARAGRTDQAYQTVVRLQEYAEGLRSKIESAQLVRAAAEIDLDEHARARAAAERATTAEREAANLRSRYFWLALLAAAIVLSTLVWAYLRSQRDQRLIAEQNQLVTQSLSEKEVLLREIHHRVKNNLQIISSLLQKQARLAGDGDAKRMAKEGQERIQSMALIHQNLYQSEQLSGVNIRSYLEDLGANIGRSNAKPGTDIELELAVEDQYLDLDTAIPVGLILNELLTNAYKYAFPEGGTGQIQVIFQRIGDHFELEVNDSGIGLPPDHAERIKKSLGHNLVKGLVRQLEGSIEWLEPAKGTAVKIEF